MTSRRSRIRSPVRNRACMKIQGIIPIGPAHQLRTKLTYFYRAEMNHTTCAHRDVRQFHDLRCCMSCGETVHLWPHLQPQNGESSPGTEPGSISSGLTHEYSDLSLSTGTAIRLIVLFPGSAGELLYCTVTAADPYKEDYDALSYTWATEDVDDGKTGRIHCPDGVVAITENCEAALRHLRFQFAPRQLWVDAICIDQSNVKERNHQVGLMDQIFKSASTVHICIKDPSHHYSECIKWLRSGLDFDPEHQKDHPFSAITQT